MTNSKIATSVTFDQTRKSPMGMANEWLDFMGIDINDRQEIVENVKKSEEFQAMLSAGWVLRNIVERTGSMIFVKGPHQVSIQIWGKANFQQVRNAHSRWPARTGKPRVVVGDSIKTGIASMKQTMRYISKLK